MNNNVNELTRNAELLLGNNQLSEARELFEKIIEMQPDDADSWLMLGAVNGELGDLDQAISCCKHAIDIDNEYIDAMLVLCKLLISRQEFNETLKYLNQAIEIDSGDAEIWRMLASIHGQIGNYEESERCSNTAIQLEPDHAGGYTSLCNSLVTMGRTDEAKLACQKATELDPTNPVVLCLLGHARELSKEWRAAQDAYQRALSINNSYSDAWTGLGRTRHALDDISQSEQAFLQALQCNPNDAATYLGLGILYTEQDNPDARHQFQLAIDLKPDFVQAWLHLGILMQKLGQTEEAVSCYDKALFYNPNDYEAHYNKGVLYQELGKLESAKECYERSIEVEPDFVLAHWNKSFIHLILGDYEPGWDEYEWRLKRPENIPRPFTQPVWSGTDLGGKSILVHDEQGYGDTFQFIRYLQLIEARNGRVYFECHKGLGPVLEGYKHCDMTIERSPSREIPDLDFDFHVDLLSLPRLFGTRLDSIPQEIPYIFADYGLTEFWRQRLAEDQNFRIGLVWEGGAQHTNNLNRSCRLTDFEPLSRIPGISLYSLQKGTGIEQAEDENTSIELIRLDNELDLKARFVDTAAVMMNLDLIISVDTAASHLAGALGRPVWTLLCANPDWRWLLEGSSSPWYPNMRLFRQTSPGYWGDTIDQLVGAVEIQIASNKR